MIDIVPKVQPRVLALSDGPVNVHPLGLGLMSMSGVYGRADEKESISTIHRALDLGVDMLDTADMYGWGHNEELLGRAIVGRRDQVVIATKFGQVKTADGGMDVDGRPEYVSRACDACLKRLRVETIDLFYLHRIDDKIPVEETIGAMARLVEQGKVRALGLSEARPDTVRRAAAVYPIAAVQNEYSVLSRHEGDETLEAVRGSDALLVAYAPLGRGLLFGALPSEQGGDARRAFPRFQGKHLERNLGLVREFNDLAKNKGCSAAQLALAWLLRRANNVIPIPGAKQIGHIEDNLGAIDVPLSLEEIAMIEQIMPPDAASGDRYPPEAMRKAYR